MPTLSITLDGGSVTLEWPNVPSIAVLEQSVAVGAAWVAVTNTPVPTPNVTWITVLPVEAGARLFRLRLP